MVTLLAFVVAMIVGAILIAVADPQTPGRLALLLPVPAGHVHLRLPGGLAGYVALFQGAVFDPHRLPKGHLAGSSARSPRP